MEEGIMPVISEITEENAEEVRETISSLLRSFGWTEEADDVVVLCGIYIGGKVQNWIDFGDRILSLNEREGITIKRVKKDDIFSAWYNCISIFTFDGEEFTDSFTLEKTEARV